MNEPIELPIMRTSERKDFKRCPQRWKWAWRDGLKPQGPDPINLWFGTGIHLGMAHWYIPGKVRGIDPRETFEKFVKDEIRHLKLSYKDEFGQWESEFVEAGSLGEDMLTEYLNTYGHDEQWEFIAPEQKFSVILKHPLLGKVVRFVGTFDGAMINHDEDGRIELLETKTAKSIATEWLELDDQAGGYWAVGTDTLRAQGLIGPKEILAGIQYNFLKKALIDQRPRNDAGEYLNKDMTVSKNQPKPAVERHFVEKTRRERSRQLKSIMAEAQAMRRFETGEQEMYKASNWNCHWDCQFYQMCQLNEVSPDVEEFQRFAFAKRDPYADHRKSTAE